MPPPLPLPPPSPPVSPPPSPPGGFGTPSGTTGPSYGGITFTLGTNPSYPRADSPIFRLTASGSQTLPIRTIVTLGTITFPDPPPPGLIWHYFIYTTWAFSGGCNYPPGSDTYRLTTYPYLPRVTDYVYAAGSVAFVMYAMPRTAAGIPDRYNQLQVGTYAVKYRLVVYSPAITVGSTQPPPLAAHDQWYDGGTVTFTS